MGIFSKKSEEPTQVDSGSDAPATQGVDNLENPDKSFFQRLWPVFACGAGLFSDGYINNVIGSVSTLLGTIYGDAYTTSGAKKNVSSIAFVGTVVGMFIFGYLSDKWSRKQSLVISTGVLALFAALGAASYGAGGSTQGMFAALTAYRFFVGVGIGGEYPAGSVSCAESSGEMKKGTRNRWFILFTNVMIDWGFVAGAMVPYVAVVACGEKHLRAAWRISLGIGTVCPVLLMFMRVKLKEPEEFNRESMKYVKIPYGLVLKFYWKRLFIVSLIWFIYDFSTYSFGLFSTSILANIFSSDAPLSQSFGWGVVINLFYIPGAIFGSFYSDWIGPKNALTSGVFVQGCVGFLMAGLYKTLAVPKNVGGFAVIYGIFLSLGEVGPGDNIGLIASKTCATGVRGQYYAIAAATGKIGAFIGTYIFPYIEAAGGKDTAASAQYPFYVSSALCILSAFICHFCVPHIGQDSITTEDIRFRAYLESNGWDTANMGLAKTTVVEEENLGSSNEKM